MKGIVTRFDDKGEYKAAEIPLDERTLFVDRERGTNLMWVSGYALLPIGAVVQLADPNYDATVLGIRLLPGGDNHAAALCIELEVPKEFWYEIDREWERLHPGEAANLYGSAGPPLEVIGSDLEPGV